MSYLWWYTSQQHPSGQLDWGSLLIATALVMPLVLWILFSDTLLAPFRRIARRLNPRFRVGDVVRWKGGSEPGWFDPKRVLIVREVMWSPEHGGHYLNCGPVGGAYLTDGGPEDAFELVSEISPEILAAVVAEQEERERAHA